MGLVTCCPKCESEYEVTADQLKLHDGLVRCGQCSHVFDGFACLKDALPTLTQKVSSQAQQKTQQTEESIPTPAATPVLSVPVSQPASQPIPPVNRASTDGNAPFSVVEAKRQALTDSSKTGPFVPSVDRQPAPSLSGLGRREPALGAASSVRSSDEPIEPSIGSFELTDLEHQAREPTLGTLPSGVDPVSAKRAESPSLARVLGESRIRGDDPSAFGRTVPEFLEEEEEISEGASIMWLLGSIILAVVLIVQSLVVFRNDIVVAAPGMRPLLVQLCKPLSCEVSHVRQIEQIFVVGSKLQQAPDATVVGNQRSYVLTLTLQNRSSYPQPWPALMLTLTDASGTAVIKKALLPSTFLSPSLLEGPMKPRQEVGLEIPLIVEGLSISGFEVGRFFP